MVRAPPVVMLTTQPERCLMTLRKGCEGLRRLIRPPVLGVARMQMYDGGAGRRRGNGGIGDFLGRDR